MDDTTDPKPQTAKDWFETGHQLLRARKLPGALDAFRRSLKLNPRIVAAWFGLAQVLQANSQFDEALACLDQAVAVNPNSADAHMKRAQALKNLARVDEARQAFDQAIARDSKNIMAFFGLGQLFEDTGEPVAAAEAYRKALTLQPGHAEALSSLLGLSRHVDVSSEIEQTKRLMETAQDREKALLGYGLGRCYEHMKHHSDAFDAFETANLARRSVAGDFDRALFDKRIVATIELFSQSFFERRKDWGISSDRPVFIVGLPRSGTTLTEQIIGSHPDCFGAGELHTLTDIATATPDRLGSAEKPWPDCAPALRAGQAAAIGADYLEQSSVRAPSGVSRVVDKQPLNFWHLGLVAMALPNARIIHCTRDIRDCGFSIYMQNFNLHQKWSTDLSDIAHYWRGYRRLMAHWEAVTGLRVLTVAYEDTIENTEEQAKKLLDFLELRWDDQVLNFHENNRAVQTPSKWQVRQPVYTTSVARWARYGSKLSALIEAAEHG